MNHKTQMPMQMPIHAAYSAQNIPAKKQGKANQSNSAHVNRKEKSTAAGMGMMGQNVFNHIGTGYKLPEQLQEEVLKLKQTANTHKEENVKLKTKIKILENEMGRKERALEDFMQQN